MMASSRARSMHMVACFLCIVFLVFLAIGSSDATRALPSSPPPPLSRSSAAMNLDPLYTTKRRVPNGPDPIHNRREGKSGQPARKT